MNLKEISPIKFLQEDYDISEMDDKISELGNDIEDLNIDGNLSDSNSIHQGSQLDADLKDWYAKLNENLNDIHSQNNIANVFSYEEVPHVDGLLSDLSDSIKSTVKPDKTSMSVKKFRRLVYKMDLLKDIKNDDSWDTTEEDMKKAGKEYERMKKKLLKRFSAKKTFETIRLEEDGKYRATYNVNDVIDNPQKIIEMKLRPINGNPIPFPPRQKISNEEIKKKLLATLTL